METSTSAVSSKNKKWVWNRTSVIAYSVGGVFGLLTQMICNTFLIGSFTVTIPGLLSCILFNIVGGFIVGWPAPKILERKDV